MLDRVSAIVQVIKAHADCLKSTKFERSIMFSTIPKMLDSKLACDHSDICAMQVEGLYMRLLTLGACTRVTVVVLSVCLSVCLSICLSICLSVCLSVTKLAAAYLIYTLKVRCH